jgi:hypothetical protein
MVTKKYDCFKMIFDKWAYTRKVQERKVTISTQSEINVLHSSYDDWKTADKDEGVVEHTKSVPIDIDELEDAMYDEYCAALSVEPLDDDEMMEVFDDYYPEWEKEWTVRRENAYREQRLWELEL